jgi:hypothetical protein
VDNLNTPASEPAERSQVMTSLMPDTFGLIVLLSGVVILWVVTARLILNLLTGKVVQRYDSLDKHDSDLTNWKRTHARGDRIKKAHDRAA